MLVIDASVLCDALVGGPASEAARGRLDAGGDLASPHCVDVEVLGAIRRRHRLGELDLTAATQAIEDLADWPGERYGHRHLLPRAWELRHTVRGWDAMYVSLAEALDAPLLTADSRLAKATGPTCEIELVPVA